MDKAGGKRREDHTNIAHIGAKFGKFDPTHFCHNCRALLAETSDKGYALLDLYDLADIQAFRRRGRRGICHPRLHGFYL